MGTSMQWPLHTREDMEALRAEWENPGGVIEIMPDPRQQYWRGLFSGIFVGSFGTTLLIGLIEWLAGH